MNTELRLTQEDYRALDYLQETLENPSVQGRRRFEALSGAVQYCEEKKLPVEFFVHINPDAQILSIQESWEQKGLFNEENRQKLLELSDRIHQKIIQGAFKNPEQEKSASPKKKSASWTITLIRWGTNAAICLFLIQRLAGLAGLFERFGPVSYMPKMSKAPDQELKLPPPPNFSNSIIINTPFDGNFSKPPGLSFDGRAIQSPEHIFCPAVYETPQLLPDGLFFETDLPPLLQAPSSLMGNATQGVCFSEEAPRNRTFTTNEKSQSLFNTTKDAFQGLAQTFLPSSWDEVRMPNVDVSTLSTGALLFFRFVLLDRMFSRNSL